MKKRFICPDKVEIDIQECLKKCRLAHRCAPLAYLRQAADDRPWEGKPSVTQLAGNGTRKSFLEITQDYAIDPDDEAFSVHGRTAHAALEEKSEGGHAEEEVEFEGIVGHFDSVDEDDGEVVLNDYKTWGSYPVARALGIVEKKEPETWPDGSVRLLKSGPRKGQPKMRSTFERDPSKADLRDAKLQVNFYRLAWDKREQDRDAVERLEYDWQEPAAMKITSMRLFLAVRDGKTRYAKERGVLRNTYYLDIPTMTEEQVMAVMRAKRDALLDALAQHVMDQSFMPEACSREETWEGRRCAEYCPVARFCIAHGDNPYISPSRTEEPHGEE